MKILHIFGQLYFFEKINFRRNFTLRFFRVEKSCILCTRNLHPRFLLIFHPFFHVLSGSLPYFFNSEKSNKNDVFLTTFTPAENFQTQNFFPSKTRNHVPDQPKWVCQIFSNFKIPLDDFRHFCKMLKQHPFGFFRIFKMCEKKCSSRLVTSIAHQGYERGVCYVPYFELVKMNCYTYF